MKIYGDGSIQQLDKDVSRYKCRRWRLFVKTEQGMRTRHFSGTVREAKQALRGFVGELEGETPTRETFGAYAERWLDERAASGDFSPNTIRKDKTRVRALCREFGPVALSDMTPARVRSGLVAMRNGGNATGRTLSGAYANGLCATLGAIMRQAVGDGVAASNPCDAIRRPKRDTPEKHAIDAAGLSALLDRLDAMPVDGRVMAVYLMACLGLRRGEACGLYWDDVRDGCVHVVRAMREADCSIADPKTSAGVRTLPMPRRLAEKMAVWRAVAASNGRFCPNVCLSTNGRPLRPQNLYKWWIANRASLGVDGMTLHELRHSNLSMMARTFRSVFDLQYWAGWSSIEPAKIYIHKDADELKRAAESVEL